MGVQNEGALDDPEVVKHAYNAPFEWYCLNQAGYKTSIGQWTDTMFYGLYLGYPAGLEAIGKAIGLPQDKQKLSTGKALIRYFCTPCKPTKANGGRTRNLPEHDPEKWKLFKGYCKQDVVTETEIYKRLSGFSIPKEEQENWVLDIEMNAKGVPVDVDLIDSALAINDFIDAEMNKEAKKMTGIKNPNSATQLLSYLRESGFEIDNLTKETVSDLLKKELPEDIHFVIDPGTRTLSVPACGEPIRR